MEHQASDQPNQVGHPAPAKSDARSLTLMLAVQGLVLLLAEKQILPAPVALLVWMLLFGAIALILVRR
ncbi:hypothetical protein Pan44_29630 [Caulifigura coniformis]|uniref:Uncharacterized protein n=1 Tax=Caulifigura coniformis TaxID=2527983 RepID=A0A517SFL8_9PLAN|nr:hypothetical protein [Caulifigura coniformis]QDT54923.1 hypothetical protein Pan44_29630 [Caulifigura coniformis]